VVGVHDVFDELQDRKAEKIYRSNPSAETPSPVTTEVTDEEKILLEQMGKDPLHLDALSRSVGLPSRRLSELLLVLEIKGLVEQAPGHCYLRL
jgi:DNA processing protein